MNILLELRLVYSETLLLGAPRHCGDLSIGDTIEPPDDPDVIMTKPAQAQRPEQPGERMGKPFDALKSLNEI